MDNKKEIKQLEVRICLDKALEKRKMTRYQLSQEIKTAYPTIDRYYKNKIMRYDRDLLAKICTVLNCGIEEIIEVYEQPEETEN